MQVIRENHPGDMGGSRKSAAKGKAKKSDWDLEGQGKAGGWKERGGTNKGKESAKKRKD